MYHQGCSCGGRPGGAIARRLRSDDVRAAHVERGGSQGFLAGGRHRLLIGVGLDLEHDAAQLAEPAGLLEAGRRVGLRADRLGPPPAMCTAAGKSSISSCRASADSPHTTARGARAHGRQIRVRGLRCICSPVDPAGEFVCLAFRDQVRQIAGGEQGLTCLRRRERRGEAGQPLLQARVLRSTRVSGGTPQVSSGDRQGSRRCE